MKIAQIWTSWKFPAIRWQSWLRLVLNPDPPPMKKGGSDKYSTTSMYIGLWNFITLPDDCFNHISNLYWASSLQTISFFSSHFISSGTTKWKGNGNGKGNKNENAPWPKPSPMVVHRTRNAMPVMCCQGVIKLTDSGLSCKPALGLWYCQVNLQTMQLSVL